MNLRRFILHFHRFRLLSLSVISLGLGLFILVPVVQPNDYPTTRLPDYSTTQLSDYPTTQLPDYRTIELSNYQTNPTPTPFSNPTATPPTQGGHGRDVFYLYCMPCHGDLGQGLTDEFRNRQYPPEDTNCWKSGCHGDNPYANGFKLPKTIPALIGTGTLQRFETAQNMYDFVQHAMPFNKPGSLSEEQYLQVMAYLLESNQIVPAGTQLEPGTLSTIVLRRDAAVTPTPAPDSTAPSQASPSNPYSLLIGATLFLVVALVLSLITRPRRSRK